MTQSLRFAIAGIAGRMGRQLAAATLAAGHQLAGATERAGAPELGADIALLAGAGQPMGTAPVTDPGEAARNADIWLDFTAPGATLAALSALHAAPVRAIIIGTTGFSAAQDAEIAAHSTRFSIVRAGNFSLGVNLLAGLVRIAAARLGEDWDIEISETHHRHKLDAPSGTALMLAQAAARGRGAPLSELRRAPYDGPDAKRAPGEIAFSVRRAGGVVGDHEVVFGSEAELLTLGHRALDRRVFAEGAIRAAQWAATQSPGLYDMEDVLGLKGLAG